MTHEIEISGFYKDDKSEISGYKCRIGLDINNDDDGIFYFFADGENILGDHGDFYVTSYEEMNGDSKFIWMTDEKFITQFEPQTNHLDDNASWGGMMYETYGAEMDYVRKIYEESPGRVWTVLDDGEVSFLSSGFHFVNRMGYIVTKNVCPDNVEIEVNDDYSFSELAKALALGFDSIAAMQEHEAWLDAHGTPEFKKWKSEVVC